MANTLRSKITEWLKRFRNFLVVVVGALFVVSIFYNLSLPPGKHIPGMLAIFVGLSIPFLFLLQLVIVILVGKPKISNDKSRVAPTPIENPEQLKDVSYEDWLGSNAYRRLLKWAVFFLIMFVYWVFRSHSYSVPWLFYLIAALIIMWSVTYSVARITFQKDGVLFDSAVHHTIGLGRTFFVPYHELTVRQTKFWANWGVPIYRNGRRLYLVNERQWLTQSFLGIVCELSKQLPPNQCELLKLYKN